MSFDRQQAIFALTNNNLSKAQRKRIMREFSIGEISAVDTPAQLGARALVIKRNEFRKGPGVEVLIEDEDEDTSAPADEPERTEEWRAYRDAMVKDFAAVLQEETAEIAKDMKRREPRKENTMFENEVANEVAKARAAGKSLTEAMAKARLANPDAFAAYQRQGIESVAKADDQPQRMKKSADQISFDAKVGEIAKRDGCTRTAAMIKARKDHPDLFQRAFG